MRAAALLLALLLILTACAPKTVQQGMVTADGMTFLAATVTAEETVTVSVTLTNGGGSPLWLAAPELTDGTAPTAFYLSMSLAGSAGERTALTETGERRRLVLDGRESYREDCVFTGVTLPAALTVTVSHAAAFDGEYVETTVTLPLK